MFFRSWTPYLVILGLLFFATGLSATEPFPPLSTTDWDNGSADHAHGLSVTGQDLADDFELGAAAVPTSVLLNIWDSDGTGLGAWDGILRWWIYLDNAGEPGSLLYSGFGRNILVLGDGTSGFFLLTFQFGRTVPLQPTTRYWLSVHLGQNHYYVNNLSWSASSSSHWLPGEYSNWGTEPWTAWVMDFSFALQTDTIFNYLFTDGVETGDLSLWSSHSG